MSAKKTKYYITENQVRVLITEELRNPALMNMIGGEGNSNARAAHQHPISTGKFDEEKGGVGVGTGTQKEDEPKPDLRALPKSPEIKEAYAHLQKAAELILAGAPKLNEENLKKTISGLHSKINKIMMEINAEINVNEVDLA